MGKKTPEHDKKKIKREYYKTSTDCLNCKDRCNRGIQYLEKFQPGKSYACVPCFK
jgi:hypothetical protein